MQYLLGVLSGLLRSLPRSFLLSCMVNLIWYYRFFMLYMHMHTRTHMHAFTMALKNSGTRAISWIQQLPTSASNCTVIWNVCGSHSTQSLATWSGSLSAEWVENHMVHDQRVLWMGRTTVLYLVNCCVSSDQFARVLPCINTHCLATYIFGHLWWISCKQANISMYEVLSENSWTVVFVTAFVKEEERVGEDHASTSLLH